MSDRKKHVSAHLDDESWKAMARWLADTDIDRAEVCGPGWQVHLDKASGYVACQTATTNSKGKSSQAVVAKGTSTVRVSAPIAGVFLEYHPMRTAPLVRLGSSVKVGDTLALLKIGQLLVPVTAPADGVIVRLLVAHQSIVGYGCDLFEMDGRSM